MNPTDEQPISATVSFDAVLGDPLRLASEPGGGVASLDKIRDILFGVQMREYDRRFTRLEERLAKETADLKDEVRKRLDALERYVRQEAESLSERLRAEHEQRVESDGGLANELRDTARGLERRTTQIDELLARGHRELRQQMLEQHQHLSDEIRQKMEDVLAALGRESRELRTDKADRAVIASLLSEMALRLGNQVPIPGLETVENG